MTTIHRFTLAVVIGSALSSAGGTSLRADDGAARLAAANTEAPFCYLRGGVRTWPILRGEIAESDSFQLTARQGETLLAEGKQLRFAGLEIGLTEDGQLRIESDKNPQPPSLQLTIQLQRAGMTIDTQRLDVRPAPPPRPISYVADLVDDLIRIYWDGQTGKFRPIEKQGLDQYFRRLQAHGVSRLIVWQSPFPFAVDPQYLPAEDWSRYQQQAQAILDSDALTRGMAGRNLPSWKWMRMTMRLRLIPEFGAMLSRSAKDHDIKLTASFRPFEPALTKYYEVPAFDQQGKWLWGFLPTAWPTVNYQTEQVGFANFRTILKQLGRGREADVKSIEFRGVKNAQQWSDPARAAANLKIVASQFPPTAADSFVLVRGADNSFSLKKYSEIARQAEQHQVELKNYRVTVHDDTIHDDVVRIDTLQVPAGYQFLIISRRNPKGEMIAAPLGHPIVVRSRAGNRLGRVNAYRCFDPSDPDAPLTRIAGITPDGGFRTLFQAIENSIDRFGFEAPPARLQQASVVVDLGADWSVEMLDFERTAARKLAIDQLKMQLAYPAFDEIFINTRSHTQLAATLGDAWDAKGPVAPMENYRLKRKPYRHLGIDLAFAPISLASQSRITQTAANDIEQITHWQDDEWIGPCQSAESRFVWRFERNRAVAAGLRLLLLDLERAFPKVRIRAVIPPSEQVIRATQRGLDQLQKPGGDVFGRGYYRHIRSSLNYIPNVGEGMAMVDLTGLSTEPVFLGIRFAPDKGPLDLYLREWFADMSGNRGSKFRGPRSFFYEAQETLRGASRTQLRPRREQIICDLLSHETEIAEVILYEAADWTYSLPLADPDHCGHGYLDRCKTAPFPVEPE